MQENMKMTKLAKILITVSLAIYVMFGAINSATADPIVIQYDRYSGARTIEGDSKGKQAANKTLKVVRLSAIY